MGKPFVGVHIPAGTGPFPAVLFHKTAEMSPRIFGPFWPFFRPFWAHFGPPSGLGSPQMQWGTLFGPFWGLGSPQRQGGTGQERPKGGQKAIEMCFGTVLDHLDAILVHFEPKPKIEIFSILRPFWAFFGPFFGPLNSAKSFWGPPPLPQY